MKIIALLLFCVLFHSCNSSNKDSDAEGTEGSQKELATEEKEFAELIDGIPIVKLPRELSYWLNDIPKVTKASTKKWQEQFWEKYSKNVWGRVFVDEPNIYLLATQPDDQGTIFLMTFDRFGKFMLQEALQRGYYVSADPEYATSNYSTLYPDMRLIEIDSLFKYPYDSTNNNRLEGDEMCKVTYQEYKIANDGKLGVIRYDTTGFFRTGLQ